MKIILISEWYSDKMGYAENNLPKALGKLGHEVHLVTADVQVYGTSDDYEQLYQNHLGPKKVEEGVFARSLFPNGQDASIWSRSLKARSFI